MGRALLFFALLAGSAGADEALRDYAATRGFSFGRPTAPQLTPDGKTLLFLRGEARSPVASLWALDLDDDAARERVLFAAGGAEAPLSEAEKARRERARVVTRGVAAYQLARDGASVLVPLGDKLYVVGVRDGARRELPIAGPFVDPRLSPDGRRVAFVRERDLWVAELADGKARRVMQSHDDGVSYGSAEFVAQEEMGRMRGFWWSPDSQRLAFEEADCRAVETLHIADPTRPERAPATTRYPRAGKANCAVRVGVIAVGEAAAVRWVDWDRARWPYLVAASWDADAAGRAPLTLVVERRDQRELAVLADAGAGAPRTLLTETDAAWLNVDPAMPAWLPDGSAFLWSTERDGGPALELRAADGKRLRALTRPADGYAALVRLDGASRRAFFMATPDPREEHLYAVPLDGKSLPLRLTAAPGVHLAQTTPGGALFVDRVRDGDHLTRMEVVWPGTPPRTRAVPSVAVEPPLRVAELVEVKTAAGTLHAMVVRPRDFVPGRKYPVLLRVYGGPHVRLVTRTPTYLEAWIADHGFIVVSVDGRGTPGRGRAWERAFPRSFLPRLDDQVDGLRALAARFAELDLGRVGVFGWSFGGWTAALAALHRPDVFHAAVAGAPVVDWQDYDTHYTERYLGLPAENARGYHESALTSYARELRRPLLLIHGTADDNVYFSQSLKLADALFAAGKRFELAPLAGQTHMVAGAEALERVYGGLADFFARELAGDGR